MNTERTAPDHRPALGTIAVFGLGAFGALAAGQLAAHGHDVAACDPDPARPTPPGVTRVDESAAAARPVVILAVNAPVLPVIARSIAPRLESGAIVADVCSVKVNPLRSLAEALPAHAQILGTHPLFGPQTVAEKGLAGQPIALCPERAEDATVAAARALLASGLGLRVIDVTPDEHDRQMAMVQVLTHLVGHAASELALPDLPLATLAYTRLRQLMHNIEGDSEELFAVIQNDNPYAAETRERMLRAMQSVHERAARAHGQDRP